MLPGVTLDSSCPPSLLGVTLSVFGSSCYTVKVAVMVSKKDKPGKKTDK